MALTTRTNAMNKIETPEVVRADLAKNGHGHVVPRKDGMLARCGGPVMCPECFRDQSRLQYAVACSEIGQGEGRR